MVSQYQWPRCLEGAQGLRKTTCCKALLKDSRVTSMTYQFPRFKVLFFLPKIGIQRPYSPPFWISLRFSFEYSWDSLYYASFLVKDITFQVKYFISFSRCFHAFCNPPWQLINIFFERFEKTPLSIMCFLALSLKGLC